VACYRGTNGRGYSRVCEVSGTDATYGPEKVFRESSNCQYIECVGLTSTRIVVFYEGEKAIVGTVSGTDITYGSEIYFTAGSYGGTVDQTPAACKLTSSKFFVCWFHNQDGLWQTGGRVGEVTGTTITWGTYAAIGSAFGYSMCCAALTDEKVVTCYHGTGGNQEGIALVADISSMTTTWGPSHAFTATFPGDAVVEIVMTALTSDRFVVAYREGANTKARVGVVSLTDVTWGAAATMGSPSDKPYGVALISPTEFVCLYSDDSYHIQSKVGTVTGGISIAFGTEDTLLPAAQLGDDRTNALARLGDTGPGGGVGPSDQCAACYVLASPGWAASRIGNA